MLDHRSPGLAIHIGSRPRSSCRTPRTPRTPDCTSPLPFLLGTSSAANRKSSDSWNSLESADCEPDREWKTDHLRFLLRTLDALPATNNTPFNGIPPANLLDKIARGVTGAKKEDWPHTVRQTRMKLLELSRVRAKEVVFEDRLSAIIHEEVHEDGGSDIENDFARATTPARTPGKKPLHRQSSMDFMSSAKLGNKAIDSFGRLSRIQHGPTTPTTDRRQSSLLNPCTPSSSTLNSSRLGNTNTTSNTSLSSLSNNALNNSGYNDHNSNSNVNYSTPPRQAKQPKLARRASAMTISSVSTDSYSGPCLLDPRVQRIRHSGSFSSLCGNGSPGNAKGSPGKSSPEKGVKRSLKRAPSCGSSLSHSSLGSTKIDTDVDMAMSPSARIAYNSMRSEKVGKDGKPVKVGKKARERKGSTSSQGSDEEEKTRGKKAKKARRRSPSPPLEMDAMASSPMAPLPPSSLPCSPYTGVDMEENAEAERTFTSRMMAMSPGAMYGAANARVSTGTDVNTNTTTANTNTTTTSTTSSKNIKKLSLAALSQPVRARSSRQNPKRNLSMFGPELPQLTLTSGQPTSSMSSMSPPSSISHLSHMMMPKSPRSPRSPMSACPSAFPAQITAAVAVSAATEAEQRQEAEMERRREKQAKAERATGRRAPVRSARGDAENAIGLGHALVEAPTYSPSSGPQRLRRVKGTTFGHGLGHGLSGLGHGSPPMVAPTARSAAAVGRRISFGSAPRGRDLCASVHSPYSQDQAQRHPTADETAAAILAAAEAARGLEGAFQLR